MIRSAIAVNQWQQQLPSVDEARPARCPVCGAAARPAGDLLGLHGHGLRDRQLRGPPAVGGLPITLVIVARRYRCRHCTVVLIVVPRETLPRRHYAASAIALALVLYGTCGQSHAQVRAAVSSDVVVGVGAEWRWATLSRWVDAVADRRFFIELPSLPQGIGRRAVAERAAMAIGAHAPPSLPEGAPVLRAFAGAVHMA